MEQIGKIAEIYKAFSDPTRLKILKLLVDHKFQCVNAITGKLGVTQSAVSQHLRILSEAGILKSRKEGTSVYYTINDKRVMGIIRMLKGN